jgi:hypothetical protein
MQSSCIERLIMRTGPAKGRLAGFSVGHGPVQMVTLIAMETVVKFEEREGSGIL